MLQKSKLTANKILLLSISIFPKIRQLFQLFFLDEKIYSIFCLYDFKQKRMELFFFVYFFFVRKNVNANENSFLNKCEKKSKTVIKFCI